MRVQFWGTRGSVPSPGPSTARYGGNTSCVTVRADDGTLIILDCGTGARPLGLSLLAEPKPIRAHMLIGHTHWDHIQGLPFFVPAFLPDTELTIHAPAGFEQSLAESLAGQMQHSYFPLALQELRSRIVLHDLEEGTFQLGGVTVETHYLNHTAPTLGYRISAGGVTMVYATDHEPYWHGTNGFIHPGDRDHIDFIRGADLLVHDAQYTLEEYPTKVSWGHSTIPYVTEVAMEAGVKRLALFHHDPTRDDAAVARLEAQAQAMAAARRSRLEVFAAAEGQDIYLPENAAALPPAMTNSAFMRASVVGARILVAIDDPERARLVSTALTKDRFELIMATDGHAALSEAMLHRPDMVVLDARLPGLDSSQLVQALRSSSITERVPVLMITSSMADEAALRGLTMGATDCLAEPLSVPMLRFRVRMWLLRSSRDSSPVVHITGAANGNGLPVVAAPVEDVDDVPAAGLEARMARRARLLADLPLFRGLPSEQLLDLARQATEYVFAPGADIIRQGDPGDALYVIVSGQVTVRASRAEGGPEALLGTLGPGAVFGEMALVDDGPRSATVRAQARTRTVILRRNDFLAGLASSAGLARALLLTLSNRLREADLLLAREAPDPVTGLMSRRTFEDYFEREAALARQRSGTVAVLLVWGDWPTAPDDDGNQTDIEEETERALADAVRKAVRATDVIARWDTRRLVVLLTEWVHRDTKPVVTRMQHNFRELVKERGLSHSVTLRSGEVILTSFDVQLAEVIEEAQAAAAGMRGEHQ